jgi:hypothetical protein
MTRPCINPRRPRDTGAIYDRCEFDFGATKTLYATETCSFVYRTAQAALSRREETMLELDRNLACDGLILCPASLPSADHLQFSSFTPKTYDVNVLKTHLCCLGVSAFVRAVCQVYLGARLLQTCGNRDQDSRRTRNSQHGERRGNQLIL